MNYEYNITRNLVIEAVFSEFCFDSYDCGDQIKENERGGTCSTHGRVEKYNILVEKPEGRSWKI
jgi:hypothetical protein